MKLFCFIFSLYFLALGLMPCNDIHNENTSGSTELANILTGNHSDCPHEQEQDSCSPFCVCSCCGQVLSTAKLHKLDAQRPIHNFSEKISFHYSLNWQSGYLKSIFRPPQF